MAKRSEQLDYWQQKGEFLEVGPFKHKVFLQDYGRSNTAAKNTLLLLHGFPESSYSYHKVINGLAKRFQRIVVFDMLGYGLSDKPSEGYTYSLFEQADVALQVWKHLGIKGGHLLSHDMGDSVATELVTREVQEILPAWFSDSFLSYTFTNGSMVLELAKLRITQKILLSNRGHWMSKLSTFKIFDQQIRSAHGNTKLSEEDIALLWENVVQQEGHRKNHLMIKYLNDRKRFEKTRWLPHLSKTKVPIHLCWGEADAVAKVSMAHHLHQKVCTTAQLTLMKGVGHFCQLGSPEIWVESVLSFYDTIGE